VYFYFFILLSYAHIMRHHTKLIFATFLFGVLLLPAQTKASLSILDAANEAFRQTPTPGLMQSAISPEPIFITGMASPRFPEVTADVRFDSLTWEHRFQPILGPLHDQSRTPGGFTLALVRESNADGHLVPHLSFLIAEDKDKVVQIIEPFTPILGQTYRITARHTGTHLRLFVNAVEIGSAPWKKPVFHRPNTIYSIGCGIDSARVEGESCLQGKIMNVFTLNKDGVLERLTNNIYEGGVQKLN